MHAFRNSARGKHFIGGDGDLDHGLVRMQVSILVMHDICVCVLNGCGCVGMPAMNCMDYTDGRGNCGDIDMRETRYRYLNRMERGWLHAFAWHRQKQSHES